ncbi:MAG TPA: hypothetical protein VLG13_01140 [Patescibacteria group bacterium]|nr:hypothetical protein [Patescibacteria group bacterium]
MVRVPSVESLVDSTRSESFGPFDGELLGLEATTVSNGSPKLEATTAMLGRSGMTDAELEVVQSDMTTGQLEKAIKSDEREIVKLQLLQSARRQAIERLKTIHGA